MRGAWVFVLWLLSAVSSAQINVEAVVENARQALSLDNNAVALQWLDMALKARPTYSRAYYYKAYAHFNMGEYKMAVTDCDSSIALNPFIIEVYQFRGLCKLHLEDWQGAAADYERVLEEKKEDESALFNAALCLQKIGKPEEAIASIDRILSANPRFRRGWLFKAQIALERKDTLCANALMDTALSIHRADPQTLIFKGHYALDHNQLEAALAYFGEAIGYDNSRSDAYVLRAQCFRRLGKNNEAAEDEQRARELLKKRGERKDTDASLQNVIAPETAIEKIPELISPPQSSRTW